MANFDISNGEKYFGDIPIGRFVTVSGYYRFTSIGGNIILPCYTINRYFDDTGDTIYRYRNCNSEYEDYINNNNYIVLNDSTTFNNPYKDIFDFNDDIVLQCRISFTGDFFNNEENILEPNNYSLSNSLSVRWFNKATNSPILTTSLRFFVPIIVVEGGSAAYNLNDNNLYNFLTLALQYNTATTQKYRFYYYAHKTSASNVRDVYDASNYYNEDCILDTAIEIPEIIYTEYDDLGESPS